MRISRRGAFTGLAVLALAGLLLVPIQMSWSAAEPIKIGEVGPLSPPGGYEDGKLMLDAALMAQDEINKAGGVLGRPIKIVEADTRGKPEEGTAGAERLTAQEHVAAIFGEFHSGVFLAEMEVAHKTGTPIVAVDVWANKITAKGYPEVFRVAPCQAIIANRYGDWIAAAGFKNVLLLYEKTDGGEGHRDVLVENFKKHGIHYDVVGADLNQTEFTAQLQRILAHNPPYDFLAVAISEDAGAFAVVNQAKSLGLAPSAHTGTYNSGGPATTEAFWKNVREAGVGLITENPGLPKAKWNAKTKAFVAAFEARFKSGTTPQSMESYDAAYIVVDAIKRAGSTDPKAIIHALETSKWSGTRGAYAFSTSHSPDWAYHQYVDAPLYLLQYDKVGQKPEDAPVIWPRSLATVPYTYKKPAQ
ncbi:MAG TPA: ABC transporter substrate-binding protein [bacterium]|nr:ABC transporter substrate-binding protein [bacterium]